MGRTHRMTRRPAGGRLALIGLVAAGLLGCGPVLRQSAPRRPANAGLTLVAAGSLEGNLRVLG